MGAWGRAREGRSEVVCKKSPREVPLLARSGTLVWRPTSQVAQVARLVSLMTNKPTCQDKKKLTNKVIDTLILAREKFPGSPVSLDALCKRYKVDNSKRTNHTALIDCDLLSKVYINLTDQKEPKLNFLNKDEENLESRVLNVNYYKKIIKISSDELLKHKDYLKKNLKKNFFN